MDLSSELVFGTKFFAALNQEKLYERRELEYIKSNTNSSMNLFVSSSYLILEIKGSLNSYCSGLSLYQAYTF